VRVEINKIELAMQHAFDCKYCKRTLIQPVTLIPCGHCFCRACEKGYKENCSACGNGKPTEARYRNELMDDFMRFHGLLTDFKAFIG
jgi:hypothetical protein